MMQWPLTKEQKETVELNANLQLAAYTENGIYEFDINNNYTIRDYPTSTSPTYMLGVRQAIAYLVDKDYIIAHILEFFATRIDAPVCFPQTEGWVNASVVNYDWNHNGHIDVGTEDKYPYPYSPENAAKALADLGFSDTNHNGYLNYPNNPTVWGDAAGIETTAMPLKICIRSDDPKRQAAGQYLYGQLEGDPTVAGDSVLAHAAYWAAHGLVGGDFDTTDETWDQPRPVVKPIVMTFMNYHIYTGGWSFGRYPTYIFSLFNSMFWYPNGPNYVTGDGPMGRHASTHYAHPALDQMTADIWYTQSIATAQVASLKETGYHVTKVVNLPLWSYTSYTTWRKEMAAIVNMKGVGVINDYTMLNAFRGANPNLRLGVVNSWDILNVMYSQWYFEFSLLDRVYTGGMAANPYDLALDLPWIFQDWKSGWWIDPRDGLNKSTATYYIRKDVGCAAPETGAFAGTFTALDYEFSVWYNYRYDDDWEQPNFMDVHHTEIIDDYTVKVYFDDTSYWFLYAPTYPLLGPAIQLSNMLTHVASATFHGSDLVGGFDDPTYFEYTFTDECVVHVINATKNASPIIDGTDFYIRGGYDVNPVHCIFVNKTSFAAGDTITIWFTYAPVVGAGGLYVGGDLGYDWRDTMYSYSTHYPVAISTGGAALNKNPYFFLEDVPLGEIDWRWTKTPGTPAGGYYKIDILDVVKCTGAYSARGDGLYNSLYFPGADLDSSDLCHVGILDLVSITGKYAFTFGTPADESLCANSVGATVASATWPDLAGATSYAVTYSKNLATSLNTGSGVATAQITGGNAYGVARGYKIKGGVKHYFVMYLSRDDDGLTPHWALTSEFLIAAGASSASCTWSSLVGATGLYEVAKNQNCNFNTGTGVVTASPTNGKPHYQYGYYRAADGHWEVFYIQVG
jgi:hypothetical protein